ncbi:hypothetical protein B9T21_06615 [Wohlfahrtiimonas chitiniclastica]|uniref:hypothetical protein n=1 Tax=Wohlfahrtiimonas chitiniclastica TaxID=400946 RepID=UPI000B97EB05|nr:hypothetical protein [Wohlfahrtiimonas chitiniclastica]OYQ87208.1 hypothetical protein B9T21_06615 [Wohlfahrtiimonas chitiniclastica]
MLIDDVISKLRQKKSSLCCDGQDGVISMLGQLGFVSKPKNRGNHYVFQHSYLSEQSKKFPEEYDLFFGHSIDCAHGKRTNVKTVYIEKLIKLLELYKPLLEEYQNLSNGE